MGTKTRYDSVAVTLHWIIALLILGMLALGWYMSGLPRHAPLHDPLYNLHKSIGTLLLLLVAFRIVWRTGHKPPALMQDMPGWMHWASGAVHHLLYLAMAVMPLSGFIASMFGRGVIFFGLPLPHFAPNRALSHVMNNIHSLTAWVIAILVGLHVLAALYHQVILKDHLLRRMMPGRDA